MTNLLGSVVKWFGVRLVDGAVLCDLEGITYTELPATIGQYEAATVNLTIQTPATTPASNPPAGGTPVVLSGSVSTPPLLAPSGTDTAWVNATLPGAAALIAYVDQPGTSTPIILWGGIVTQRVRTKSNVVQLSLVTPEFYFQACYVGTYVTTANQDTILSQLVARFGAGPNQIPWVLNPLTASTQTQTVNYLAGNNTTLYKALQDLSAVAGGPEWFCDWQYTPASSSGPAMCLPRVNYGARVGTPAPPAIGPYVTIEADDCLEFQLLEDYTSGKGANSVAAYGTANNQVNGGAPPMGVQPSTWVSSGRPQWQYNYPVDATSDPSVLLASASQALTRLQNGTSAVTAVLPILSPGKQYGADWFVGDDMGYLAQSNGIQWTATVAGMLRVKGIRIGLDRVTPIVWS